MDENIYEDPEPELLAASRPPEKDSSPRKRKKKPSDPQEDENEPEGTSIIENSEGLNKKTKKLKKVSGEKDDAAALPPPAKLKAGGNKAKAAGKAESWGKAQEKEKQANMMKFFAKKDADEGHSQVQREEAEEELPLDHPAPEIASLRPVSPPGPQQAGNHVGQGEDSQEMQVTLPSPEAKPKRKPRSPVKPTKELGNVISGVSGIEEAPGSDLTAPQEAGRSLRTRNKAAGVTGGDQAGEEQEAKEVHSFFKARKPTKGKEQPQKGTPEQPQAIEPPKVMNLLDTPDFFLNKEQKAEKRAKEAALKLRESLEISKKWDADLSVGKQLHPFLQRRETTESHQESHAKQQEAKMVFPTWDPPFPSLELGNSHVNPGLSEGTPQLSPRSTARQNSKGLVPTNWEELFPLPPSSLAPINKVPEVMRFLQGEDALSYLSTCHPAAGENFPKLTQEIENKAKTQVKVQKQTSSVERPPSPVKMRENDPGHITTTITTTSVLVDNNALWTEKYRPRSSKEVLGNETSVRKILQWLNHWAKEDDKKAKEMDSDNEAFEESRSRGRYHGEDGGNCLVVVGPNGSGKTSAVYAIAAELGFEVLEVNSTSKRTGKEIIEMFGESTQSHTVLQDYSALELKNELLNAEKSRKGRKKKDGKPGSAGEKGRVSKLVPTPSKAPESQKPVLSKMSLILFEEVDLLFEEDRGFWAGLGALGKLSKRPIIVTCNENVLAHLPGLLPFVPKTVHFSFPTTKSTLEFAQLVCLKEGVVVSPKALFHLVRHCHQDLRRILLTLQFWCQNSPHCVSSATNQAELGRLFLPSAAQDAPEEVSKDEAASPEKRGASQRLKIKFKEQTVRIQETVEEPPIFPLRSIPLRSQLPVQAASELFTSLGLMFLADLGPAFGPQLPSLLAIHHQLVLDAMLSSAGPAISPGDFVLSEDVDMPPVSEVCVVDDLVVEGTEADGTKALEGTDQNASVVVVEVGGDAASRTEEDEEKDCDLMDLSSSEDPREKELSGLHQQAQTNVQILKRSQKTCESHQRALSQKMATLLKELEQLEGTATQPVVSAMLQPELVPQKKLEIEALQGQMAEAEEVRKKIIQQIALGAIKTDEAAKELLQHRLQQEKIVSAQIWQALLAEEEAGRQLLRKDAVELALKMAKGIAAADHQRQRRELEALSLAAENISVVDSVLLTRDLRSLQEREPFDRVEEDDQDFLYQTRRMINTFHSEPHPSLWLQEDVAGVVGVMAARVLMKELLPPEILAGEERKDILPSLSLELVEKTAAKQKAQHKRMTSLLGEEIAKDYHLDYLPTIEFICHQENERQQFFEVGQRESRRKRRAFEHHLEELHPSLLELAQSNFKNKIMTRLAYPKAVADGAQLLAKCK